MSRKKLAGLPALRFQVDALHSQDGGHTFRCAGNNQLISRLETQAVERFEDGLAASEHLDNAHSGAWTEPGIEQGFAHNRRVVAHDGFNSVFGDAVLSAEVLSEIPVVGGLFKSRARTGGRTNLMIFIRPRIIHSAADAQAVTAPRYDFIRSDPALVDRTGANALDALVQDYLRTLPPVAPPPATSPAATPIAAERPPRPVSRWMASTASTAD
jgi:hypothetical protein